MKATKISELFEMFREEFLRSTSIDLLSDEIERRSSAKVVNESSLKSAEAYIERGKIGVTVYDEDLKGHETRIGFRQFVRDSESVVWDHYDDENGGFDDYGKQVAVEVANQFRRLSKMLNNAANAMEKHSK